MKYRINKRTKGLEGDIETGLETETGKNKTYIHHIPNDSQRAINNKNISCNEPSKISILAVFCVFKAYHLVTRKKQQKILF